MRKITSTSILATSLLAGILIEASFPGRLISIQASPRWQQAPPARKPVRRALLVPISYDESLGQNRLRAAPANIGSSKAGAGAKTANSKTSRSVTVLSKLDGPPNDAKRLANLLIGQYGFLKEHVTILPENEATHDGILNAIQKYLIDQASPGDECMFYYSGHGSYIRNSKSKQTNLQEETIVPIDYIRPIEKREDVKDIRDRELVQWFNRAIDKGVVLTAIFDSCNSGSIVRGEAEMVFKAAPGSEFDLAEAPVPSSKPGDRGALIIAAALAHQNTQINNYSGTMYSDFTYHLTEMLNSASAESLTTEQLLQQVTARLKGSGRPAQPSLDTNAERRKLNIFGSPVASGMSAQLFTVGGIDRTKIILNQGRAFGLTTGSILVKKESAEPKIRLQITEVSELTSSVAKPVTPSDLSKIKLGDTFEMETWAASSESIRVWLPPAVLSLEEIRQTARNLSGLVKDSRIRLVEDPTEEVVTHRIFHDGRTWKLMPPSGELTDLGNSPTAQAVQKKLPATGRDRVSLFISLPLAAEAKNRVQLGPNTSHSVVNLAESEASATYSLIGRFLGVGEKIEYAWMLRGAAKKETSIERDLRLAGKQIPAGAPSPLPRITDWREFTGYANRLAGEISTLEDLALRLNKIYVWVNLQSPPTAAQLFPYKLVMLDKNEKIIDPDCDRKDPSCDASGKLLDGEEYRLSLLPLATNPQRKGGKIWIYLYTLDQHGATSLLYAPADPGIDDPFLQPNQQKLKSGKPILSSFKISGPSPRHPEFVLGAETYILLASSERLSDPDSLAFEGVRTSPSSTRRGGDDRSLLEILLGEIGATTRSEPKPVPTTWGVQHLFLQSVSK